MIMRPAVLALLVLKLESLLDAQLTPPSEPVCPGNRIIFVCHHTGPVSRWTVIGLPGSIQLQNSTRIGSIVTFDNDPGFHFKLCSVSNNPNNITSELQVTAVSELDGVRVICATGGSEDLTFIIQVASIGKLINMLLIVQ